MTYEEFLVLGIEQARNLPPALAALTLDRAGQWEAAHERAQAPETVETNRVHAYLHRKEGDASNARYWYRRVDEPMPECSLDEEWAMLARRFLG
jgi:hypothetical protein